nr:hypothetical protein Iba_scaffold11841CG0010 [Ipomoea batatas]
MAVSSFMDTWLQIQLMMMRKMMNLILTRTSLSIQAMGNLIPRQSQRNLLLLIRQMLPRILLQVSRR